MESRGSLPPLRRFVTGHKPDGNATLQSVDEGSWRLYPERGRAFNVVYTTQETPVRLDKDRDLDLHNELIDKGEMPLVNKNGSLLRIVDFAPNTDGRQAAMHRTQSLDYGIVLEGRIVMVLDEGEQHLLHRGDIAIQRATMHGWRNPSETEWARMAFVLLASEAFEVGGKSMGEDLGKDMSFLPSSGQH